MKVNTNIYIFLTPFHLKQISDISDILPVATNQLIFFSEYVKAAEILVIYPHAQLIPIPKGDIRIKNLVKSPIAEKQKLKVLLKEYKVLIESKVKKELFYNLIFGTEKDVFSQMLVQYLKKNRLKNEIIAVDEGIGFYTNNSRFYYPIMSLIYLVLSPIFLGTSIKYIESLGTMPEIDKVYVRFSEYLKDKRSNPNKYYQLPVKKKIKDINTIISSDKVLMLTTTLSEDSLRTLEEERELVNFVINLIPDNKAIYIKQHPREIDNKYDSLNFNHQVYILDKSKTAENLNFEDFGLIVNFASSVVMDLFIQNYPLDKVVTINPYVINNNLYFLFEKTLYVDLNKKDWQSLAQKFLCK